MENVYPRWRYHANELEGRIVRSAKEDADLGEGWKDSIAECSAPLHECKPGESYKEHMEAFDAKDEGEVKPKRGRKAKA